MGDSDQQTRLARLRHAERRRSARQSAMRQLLSGDNAAIEDKIAAVKTVQHEDKTRVVSAISGLMGRDGRKPD